MKFEYGVVVGVHGERVAEGGVTVYENLFDALNVQGQDGWEAVAILEASAAQVGGDRRYTVLMKRAVPLEQPDGVTS